MNTLNPSFWYGRSVFVSGATGFLGGWLVSTLRERGADIVALVRDGAPRSRFEIEASLRDVAVVHGDLGDISVLRRLLAEYAVDTVFHLAAQAVVGVARVDPVGTLEANVRGTWNVLEAARHVGVRQTVIASSDKAYGASANLPYRETHRLDGRYPYDVSKSCADLIARMYADTFSVRVCATRCANLFGGGDLNFSRTVPGVIRATLRGERFVIRSDGRFIRDYIYVRDAVEAYLCLAEAMATGLALPGEAFNFSLESPLSVLDLVGTVLSLMGRPDLEPIIHNAASAEIREQYLSADRAREVLGWSPRWSLAEGLAETIAWYERFEHRDHDVYADSRAAAV